MTRKTNVIQPKDTIVPHFEHERQYIGMVGRSTSPTAVRAYSVSGTMKNFKQVPEEMRTSKGAFEGTPFNNREDSGFSFTKDAYYKINCEVWLDNIYHTLGIERPENFYYTEDTEEILDE